MEDNGEVERAGGACDRGREEGSSAAGEGPAGERAAGLPAPSEGSTRRVLEDAAG
jgi:hypothetical protein